MRQREHGETLHRRLVAHGFTVGALHTVHQLGDPVCCTGGIGIGSTAISCAMPTALPYLPCTSTVAPWLANLRAVWAPMPSVAPALAGAGDGARCR